MVTIIRVLREDVERLLHADGGARIPQAPGRGCSRKTKAPRIDKKQSAVDWASGTEGREQEKVKDSRVYP
jgi:hypothetical protein